MKSLKSLFIYQNNFVGPIPLTLGNLRDLEIFFGQNNSFGGKMPLELWFLPKLLMLRLENNQLSGTIPGDLRILKSIQSIDISNNRFDTISESILLPSSLLSFNLAGNDIFCNYKTGETDSNSFNLSSEILSKIIGLEKQNCNDKLRQSFSIETDNIDFDYVKTDSTAKRDFWLTSNSSRTNIIKIENFDKNNFFLSDSLIKMNQDDTVYVSLMYSPVDIENHYDVLIIKDIVNNKSYFISVEGEGVESLIHQRDTSIPWKFYLHPILIDSESASLNIKYDVPEKSTVNITIYNLGGRPIKTVADGIADAGFYTFTWNGSDDTDKPLEEGEYVCVMQAGMFIQIQHILMLY